MQVYFVPPSLSVSSRPIAPLAPSKSKIDDSDGSICTKTVQSAPVPRDGGKTTSILSSSSNWEVTFEGELLDVRFLMGDDRCWAFFAGEILEEDIFDEDVSERGLLFLDNGVGVFC